MFGYTDGHENAAFEKALCQVSYQPRPFLSGRP
jgi:hypothetical protein